MGITAPLRAHPFFAGSSSSSDLVPYKYPVSIDGRPYMLDTRMADAWGQETVPLLRPQTDDSTQPGQASLNPDGLWRRGWSSWHKGAGQINRDREESSPFRFQESRGIDVWDRYELSLLPAIDQKKTTSNTNLKLAVCGSRLFLIDGQDCVYTEDITAGSPTWTNCTGEPAATLLDIASDGKNVYITDGSNVYDAVASAAPPDFTTAWSTQDVDSLAFVKGRLVGGHDNKLYTFAADGTATEIATTATYLPSTFVWTGFAGGPTTSVIYAAGFAGDKSMIFRIGIKTDGTGLDVAIPAAELPDGEIARSIGSYLGFVLIGTDTGVRFATPDTTGDLTIGALLETGSPCRCFEGQGPFVWFGWDTFNESSIGLLSGEDWHGLGRLSLEEFSSAERLAPAYATDLMIANLTASTSSVVTFGGRRVFCIEGSSQGVYAEESGPGTSGYVLSGLVDFGFTGEKTAVEAEFAYTNPASGAVAIQVEVDDTGALSDLGTITATGTGTQSFQVGPLRGSRFNVLVAMTASGAASPTLTSYALKGVPAVKATRKVSLPLLLNEHLDPDGGVEYLDVTQEREFLRGLWETRTPVSVKEFDESYTAVLEDFRWFPRMRGDAVDGFAVDGTFVALFKEI